MNKQQFVKELKALAESRNLTVEVDGYEIVINEYNYNCGEITVAIINTFVDTVELFDLDIFPLEAEPFDSYDELLARLVANITEQEEKKLRDKDILK